MSFIYISIPKLSHDAHNKRLTENFKLITQTETIASIRTSKGYKITNHHYTQSLLKNFTQNVLSDPLIEKTSLNSTQALKLIQAHYYAEVSFLPGITDNEATTLRAALKDALKHNFDPSCQTASSKVYAFTFLTSPPPTQATSLIKKFLTQFLTNPLIEKFYLLSRTELITGKPFPPSLSTPHSKSLPPTKKTHSPLHTTIPLKKSSTHFTAQSPDLSKFTDLTKKALLKLSKKYHLHLSATELVAIQNHYKKPAVLKTRRKFDLPPQPTQAELEVLAQTWSEHCKHKIFAAKIHYTTSKTKKPHTIHSLYRTYIKKLTHTLQKKRPDLLSVFHDNAGVFSFTKDWSIAMKVETHNTPAALDPFGGAITGIVGVNRDIIGTGIGANPLFNTNVFCFANPNDYPTADQKKHRKPLPTNVHHPRRMMHGVHYGVERGGNESGIPTVNGAMVFDDRFLGRPLVFCGTGGLLEKRLHQKTGTAKPIAAGDLIVTAGGRVGKDGIHGATASSHALDSSVPTSIVQIGDPITQKKLLDFLMTAKKRNLYRTLTDNGAGGLSSSVGEMAQHTHGATLYLDKVPCKYPNLAPWEILVSESQERMTLVVRPDRWHDLLALATHYDTEIASIGTFTKSGAFIVYYEKTVIAHLEMKFLHNGTPTLDLKAHFTPPRPPKQISSKTITAPATNIRPFLLEKEPTSTIIHKHKKIHSSHNNTALLKQTFVPMLKQILARPNIASKEHWVRRYDHEVKARTVIKPFDGAEGHGVNDAAVIRPLLNHRKGLAIANGIAPRYSDFDTWKMTAAAIDEAVRNLVVVGTDPKTWVGLDNFAWPDPLPSPSAPAPNPKLADLVRSAQALYKTCLAYELPLISGKDSMKNNTVLEFAKSSSKTHSKVHAIQKKHVSIPPTLLFTALGTIDDIGTAITASFKSSDSLIYLAGYTYPELGASEYANLIKDNLANLSSIHPIAKQYKNRYTNLLATFVLPEVRTKINRVLYQTTHQAIKKGWVEAAHDLSDGGLIVALSEAAFGGMIGAHISLNAISTLPLASDKKNSSTQHCFNFDTYCYSESHGRILFEVRKQHAKAFEKLFHQATLSLPKTYPPLLACIGHTQTARSLAIQWDDISLHADLAELREVWLSALNFT
ncbi:phosphoribosylformylglycinamidine synthase [Spirochaetota bacterium]|nr:phosphoribosylformylglycinamidine synthase [Spirochaetota bacterium]